MTLTAQQVRDESLRLVNDIIEYEAPFDLTGFYSNEEQINISDMRDAWKQAGILPFQTMRECGVAACFLGYVRLDPMLTDYKYNWADAVGVSKNAENDLFGMGEEDVYREIITERTGNDPGYISYSDITPEDLLIAMQQLFDENPL